MLSMLQSIDMRSQQIAQLTEILVESCVNQTEEQNELAKELDQLMTKAAMTSPMTYEFLSSPKTKFRTSPKKNTPKLVRSRHNSVGTALQPSTPVSKAKIIKKAKKPTSPKRRLSSTDEPRFYAETFSAPTSPSTSGILLHENLINIPSTSHSPPKKIIEFVEEKKVDKVAQILKAIEMSSDDFTVMVLCKLLEGYVTVGTKAVRQRRLRHMIRIDAATYFFRCIKANCHIPEPSPFKVIANDQLMTTVIRICVKDTKFLLKIRISGLLNDLCARILEVDRIFCTIALMKFTCRALKSPSVPERPQKQVAQRNVNKKPVAEVEPNFRNQDQARRSRSQQSRPQEAKASEHNTVSRTMKGLQPANAHALDQPKAQIQPKVITDKTMLTTHGTNPTLSLQRSPSQTNIKCPKNDSHTTFDTLNHYKIRHTTDLTSNAFVKADRKDRVIFYGVNLRDFKLPPRTDSRSRSITRDCRRFDVPRRSRSCDKATVSIDESLFISKRKREFNEVLGKARKSGELSFTKSGENKLQQLKSSTKTTKGNIVPNIKMANDIDSFCLEFSKRKDKPKKKNVLQDEKALEVRTSSKELEDATIKKPRNVAVVKPTYRITEKKIEINTPSKRKRVIKSKVKEEKWSQTDVIKFDVELLNRTTKAG